MVSLHAALAAIALSGMGQTVLLDFYADWCGPCKAMNPTVEALVTAGYPVQRVNIDQNRPLAAKYKVQSIPCFVMIVDGQEVDRTTGGTTFSRLERMCQMGAKGKPGAAQPAMLASWNQAAPPMSAPFEGWGNGNGRTGPQGQQPSPPTPLPTNLRSVPGEGSYAPSPPTPLPLAGEGRQLPSPLAALPKGEGNVASDAALLAASVRLRIEDPDGHSCGSGTIIDARDGEALILTCGHIFRDSKGKGKIEVDLFGPNGPQRVMGRLIAYDSETRDIGLVSIPMSGPVAAAQVAPPGYQIMRGMPVASVGCNNGDAPSVRRSQVNSLDKFAGPPNIQVAGQPVEGRSGGGLFSNEGYVIGVCNAADPSDGEGLFAALGSICAELDRANLAFVYQNPQGVGNAALAMNNTPAMPERMPKAETPASAIASLSPQEQAALDEIGRRKKEGAEVVIIVNPRDKDAKSEVFMLDHASPELLKQIAAMVEPRQERHLTSLEVPKSRKILEWSIEGGEERRVERGEGRGMEQGTGR